MKNVCAFLAVLFLVIGGIALISSFKSIEAAYFAALFLGAAFMAGIAYAHLNNQELLLAVASKASNPMKNAALEISLLFIMDAINSELDAKLINGTGAIHVTLNGKYTITNVEFETYGCYGIYSKYTYSAILDYIGGDIYDSNNWKFDKLSLYDRSKMKWVIEPEEKGKELNSASEIQ